MLSSLLLKSIDQRQPDDLGWLASVCKLTSLVMFDAPLYELLNSINYYLNFKLINRMDEHQTKLFSLQTQANPYHRVDFHNPEVIGSDNNWRRLQIQEHNPELNANIPSMPLIQGCTTFCYCITFYLYEVWPPMGLSYIYEIRLIKE